MIGRAVRVVVPALLALGVAQAEVALVCRRPLPDGTTTERCVWARAYLPLARTLYVLAGVPLGYGLLTLAGRARRRRRPNGEDGGTGR